MLLVFAALATAPAAATEFEGSAYASQVRLEIPVGTAGSSASAGTDSTHTIPFFPAASDALGRQGFARIVNLSESSGTVSIVAFDDGGRRHGPITLSMDARQTVHFNSVDLEDGEASKGLPEGTGAPSKGDWRLGLVSDLNINVLSYIRTPGGFVTSMHDIAPSQGNTHQVPFFNPGSNTAQESLLRLMNPGDAAAFVTIQGVDDRGEAAPGGAVTLTLPPDASRTLSAMDLEDGAADLDGSFGDGAGKWRLAVEADGAIMVISMLSTPTGHLTNLSTDPGGEPTTDGRPPAPTIEVTGAREFEVIWQWSVRTNETYAFDVANRFDGRDWQQGCVTFDSTGTGEATLTATVTTTADLAAGTVIESRYRYRNGSSCEAGSPGNWSQVGRTTVSGSGGTLAPDLVVESASASPSDVDPDERFTFSATVRNRGDADSDSTTLRYYRSSDNRITTSDTPVGTDPVSRLAAGATSGESIRLTAPSGEGEYYYGACVDSVARESDAGNNCSTGVRVRVESPVNGAPDLVVESPSADKTTLEADESFTLSATVRNRGDGEADSTTLRYYRSSDNRITTSDAEIATDHVFGLDPGESSDESYWPVSAPSSPGTHYYGACVDAVGGESDTANNCSASVAVTVVVPDLVVESPSVDDSTLEPGDRFNFSATVRNRGGGRSSGIKTLHYYRSSDSRITTSDTEVGTDLVGTLQAGAESEESIRLTAPSSAGDYHYGACIEADDDESDTTNNCSSGVRVRVEGGVDAPDLVVESPSASPSRVNSGGSFTFSATVRNRGDGDSASTTLRYYRSSNSGISSSDTEVGRDSVDRVAAGATSRESISLTAPREPGTVYYGACVDPVSGESDTGNNCSGGAQVQVSDGGGGADSYCRDGQVIDTGERCDVYSTSAYFEVDSEGRGCTRNVPNISDLCLSSNIAFDGGNVRIHATNNRDGSWTIDDVEPEPDD